MLLAAGSWGDGRGSELGSGTVSDVVEGPLAGVGVCHFLTADEVNRLFARFGETHVDYVERSLEGGRHTYRHWVVTGRRI
jgi:hypothetical protein